MKAYLDNSLICSIEDNKLTLENIIENVDKRIIEFPYSSAHIQEADNITDSVNGNRDTLINRRLHTIQNISNGLYLFYDQKMNAVKFQNENPGTVWETIHQRPLAKSAMRQFSNLFSSSQRELIRKTLGIDGGEINNYRPQQVVEQFNMKIALLGEESLFGFVEKEVSYYPNANSFGLINRITAIFDLLDLLGYWKDGENEVSNLATPWDSYHLYFALYCDYFISDDQRARYKSQVVLRLFGKQTVVVSSDGKE